MRALLCGAMLCLSALPLQADDEQRQWALQMGYYAELQNALDFSRRLRDAGFEAHTLTTNESSGQRYRVIAGFADDPEEFLALQDALEKAVGERGLASKNPYLSAAPGTDAATEEVFAEPKPRYLLAQAGNQPRSMAGESVGSAAESGLKPNMFRTPQEEIESIPGFTAAGLQIVTTLGLSIGYDDNITRSSVFEVDSPFYIISPAVRVELPSDHSVVGLTAAVDIIRYTDSSIDNQEPWYVRADWVWDPSTRQDFSLFARYGEGADRRGTGRRQGDVGLIPLPLDEWKRLDYGGRWRYGAVGSRGRLDLRLGGSQLEYTNNRDGTVFLDRDWNYLGGTFYWRVAPKTSLLADLQYTDIDYTVADTDSEERPWMLGVTWDATARTSGTLRYGNLEKKFDNPEMVDYDGPAWMASVNWRPRTYSLFTLTGTRSTREPDGDGDFVLRQDISLAWMHDWATRFGTVVDVGYGEDEYRPLGRTDDIFYWSIGARYTFNPHFRFGGSVQGYDRDSVDPEFDYKRTVYMLTLEASF